MERKVYIVQYFTDDYSEFTDILSYSNIKVFDSEEKTLEFIKHEFEELLKEKYITNINMTEMIEGLKTNKYVDVHVGIDTYGYCYEVHDLL